MAESARVNAVQTTRISRIKKPGVIEEIEGIAAKHERLFLRDVNVFPKREIIIQNPRPVKYIAAQVAVAARALRSGTARTHAPEVRVRRRVGTVAACSVEVSVLDTESIRARVHKLHLSSDVVRPIVARAGKRAVAAIDNVERQPGLESHDRRNIEAAEYVP